jgi:hypothetical protein
VTNLNNSVAAFLESCGGNGDTCNGALSFRFVPGLDTGQGGKKIILLRAAVEREKEKNKCENQQHCNPITNIRWHRDPNFVSTQIFQDLAGFFGLRVCLGIEPGFCCLCARRP